MRVEEQIYWLPCFLCSKKDLVGYYPDRYSLLMEGPGN